MQPRLRRASLLALPAVLLASFALANSNADAPVTSATLYFSDVDGDGLDDALAIQPNGEVALLSNRGEGRFDDITLPSGLAALEGASCALFADFDGDGLVDLFAGSSAKRMWRNLGGASFQATDSGIEHDLVDLSADAVDYDNDGWLDIQVRTEAGDVLYRNLGYGRFERVEIASVVSPSRIVTMSGASQADLDAGVDSVEQTPSRRRLGRWIRARNAAAAAAANPGSSALSALPGLTTNPTGPLGLAGAPSMICAGTIVDQATGSCIEADANGIIGKLYPLSTAFNVTSAGRVGIGTATPTATVHVSNSLAPSVRITGDDPVISLENTGSGGRNYSIYAVDGNLQLRDAFAGIPRLTIVPTGRVGIGTTTPASTLDVAGSGSFSGNVGVGTTSPARKLHVQNGSAGVTPTTNAELVVEGAVDASISLITAPNQEAAIFFGNQAAGANDGAIVWNPFGGALNEGLALRTNDTNRLVIQQDGDVGIGTTSPGARLHVNGLVRSGSETGATEALNADGFPYAGMVMRRVVSTSQTAGNVLARTTRLRVERDGTVNGLRLAYDAGGLMDQIAYGTAMRANGAIVPIVINLSGTTSAGNTPLWSATTFADVVRVDVAFGQTFNTADLTELTLVRSQGDNWWVGSLRSTFNQ